MGSFAAAHGGAATLRSHYRCEREKFPRHWQDPASLSAIVTALLRQLKTDIGESHGDVPPSSPVPTQFRRLPLANPATAKRICPSGRIDRVDGRGFCPKSNAPLPLESGTSAGGCRRSRKSGPSSPESSPFGSWHEAVPGILAVKLLDHRISQLERPRNPLR